MMRCKIHTTLVLAFKTKQKCSWTFHVLKYKFFSKTTIRNTQNQEMQTSLELDIVQHGQRCCGNPAELIRGDLSWDVSWQGNLGWIDAAADHQDDSHNVQRRVCLWWAAFYRSRRRPEHIHQHPVSDTIFISPPSRNLLNEFRQGKSRD